MQRLAATQPHEHDLRMDWDFDGVEFDEETKLREETRKIMELPELPISATCVRVPVMVGHAEAVWIETESARSRPRRRAALLGGGAERPGSTTSRRRARRRAATRYSSAGSARTRPRRTGSCSSSPCDNLRKGAALNAIQIAELLLAREAVAA